MSYNRILVINPRTHFTKIAVYDNTNLVFLNKVFHPENELKNFDKEIDQCPYRYQVVMDELKNAEIDLSSITAVVGRGGLLKPVTSGVYAVSEKILHDLKNSPIGDDSVNLGGIMVDRIARELGIKAYISDPVVVDELDPLARVAGHPQFERKSIFHALNQKAIARQYAKTLSKSYSELNLIVAHLGLGITIGAHRKGRVIDVNQGYDGEGPFSPKRSGSIPAGELMRLCFSGKYTQDQIQKMLAGKGGLLAHLGTDDVEEVEQRIKNGDKKAKLIYEAMAYQVAKWIGAMYTTLFGDVDAILITGGIAHSNYFVDMVFKRVEKLAPVQIFPGGDEMEALALNMLDVLEGKTQLIDY